MKIKAILLVFIFIIISSFLFAILSSKTNTTNNKIFYIEAFIKAVKDPLILPEDVIKSHLISGKKPVKRGAYQEISAELLRLRNQLTGARIEQFIITPYKELPEAEQPIEIADATAEDLFIVAYQDKKIMTIIVSNDKIAAFKTAPKNDQEVLFSLY